MSNKKASEINIFDQSTYLALEDFDLGDVIRLGINTKCDEVVIPFLHRAYNYIIMILQLL